MDFLGRGWESRPSGRSVNAFRNPLACDSGTYLHPLPDGLYLSEYMTAEEVTILLVAASKSADGHDSYVYGNGKFEC